MTLILIETILWGCNLQSEGVHFYFRGGALLYDFISTVNKIPLAVKSTDSQVARKIRLIMQKKGMTLNYVS